MSDGDKVHGFKDSAGEWRWRRVAPNGKVVASSGEGFKNREHAVDAGKRELDALDTRVEFNEDEHTFVVEEAVDWSE